MDNTNDIFRKLHHIGIFLLGLSAIIACIYFIFIKQDPYDQIKKEAMQSAIESMNNTK